MCRYGRCWRVRALRRYASKGWSLIVLRHIRLHDHQAAMMFPVGTAADWQRRFEIAGGDSEGSDERRAQQRKQQRRRAPPSLQLLFFWLAQPVSPSSWFIALGAATLWKLSRGFYAAKYKIRTIRLAERGRSLTLLDAPRRSFRLAVFRGRYVKEGRVADANYRERCDVRSRPEQCHSDC